MIVFVFPVGGLANRMRVIDSAVNFSKAQNCKLKIYWIRDKGLNCDFRTIWVPIPCLSDTHGRLSKFLFYLCRRFRIVKRILKVLEKFHILRVFVDEYGGKDEILYDYFKKDALVVRYFFLILKTCENFFPNQNLRNDLFQLQPDVAEQVRMETVGFNSNTIGVHIRRMDHTDSINNSPLEMFEEHMALELDCDPGTNFYIATDEQCVKNYFRNSYKWQDKVITRDGFLTRTSQEGIIQAITEMYALAKTMKILGSYRSSFSEIAAGLGNIKLEVVKTRLN